MRILAIHVTSMRYRATQKTKIAEPIDNREGKMEEGVVLFCCAERMDEKNPERVIEHAAAEVLARLARLRVRRVMIFPYAHLTSTLAPPGVALTILSRLEERLRRENVDVIRAPFGWYKEFELHSKGHPLADLSMTICPWLGDECDFTCPYCKNPLKAADVGETGSRTARSHRKDASGTRRSS
jgi:threonyl-tRNA synthetase